MGLSSLKFDFLQRFPRFAPTAAGVSAGRIEGPSEARFVGGQRVDALGSAREAVVLS